MVSVVSAPTSLGRLQMMLDVRSSRLKESMPHRSSGRSLKRLQLRSRSVRLVRNVKFCGRLPRTFFEALRVSRSWSKGDKRAGTRIGIVEKPKALQLLLTVDQRERNSFDGLGIVQYTMTKRTRLVPIDNRVRYERPTHPRSIPSCTTHV